MHEKLAVARILDYSPSDSVNIPRFDPWFYVFERFFLRSFHYCMEFLLFLRRFSSNQSPRHIATIKLVHRTEINNHQISVTNLPVGASSMRKRRARTRGNSSLERSSVGAVFSHSVFDFRRDLILLHAW